MSNRDNGSTILLQSGHYFDLVTAADNQVLVLDIAHALSHICRFTGHTRSFYSVAQHSVMVSHIVPPEHALAGLLHDAAEAFLGDVSRPLKQLLPDYQAIEKRIEQSLFEKLGLELPLPSTVKHADMVMLATEQRDLMPHHGDDWACLAGIEPLAVRITPWPPEQAKRAFLMRFDALTDSEIRAPWPESAQVAA